MQGIHGSVLDVLAEKLSFPQASQTVFCVDVPKKNEPRHEKTGLRDFRPGPTLTRLYNHTRWLEARNFGFR